MSNLKDLTGQKFGMLTVLYRTPNRKGRTYWHCVCECGTEKDVASTSLVSGATKSCGCNTKRAISRTYPDLVGMHFGRLTVESRAENKRTARAWNCVCSCGNHCVVTTYSLFSREIPSCGCYQRELISQHQLKDLTGEHIGMLTVLYRVANNKHNKVVWHCVCDCGTEINVDADSQNSGHTKSCGCLQTQARHNKFVDLSGQTFGRLFVEGFACRDQGGRAKWNCVCTCGTHKVIDGYKLKSGETRSCGCLKSKSEEIICRILDHYNIKYEVQKVFDDCRDRNVLPFDIYLPSLNSAIEYDGIFHYEVLDGLNNDLEAQQRRDSIKTNYCINHNIELLRIPYWEQDNIESILSKWLFGNKDEAEHASGIDLSA